MKKIFLFFIMLFPCFIFADDLKITKDIELYGNISNIEDAGSFYIIETSAGVYKVDKSKGIIGYYEYLLPDDNNVGNYFSYFDLNKGIVDYNTGYYLVESKSGIDGYSTYKVLILDNNFNILYSFKDNKLIGDDYNTSYSFDKNVFVKYLERFYTEAGLDKVKYSIEFYDYKFNKIGEDSLVFDYCEDCYFSRTLTDSLFYDGLDIYSYYRYDEDDNIQIIENYELDNYKFKKNDSITKDDFITPSDCRFVDEDSDYSEICIVNILDNSIVDRIKLGNDNEKILIASVNRDNDYIYLTYSKLSSDAYDRVLNEDIEDFEFMLEIKDNTYVAKLDKDYNVLFENHLPEDCLIFAIPDLFYNRMSFNIEDLFGSISARIINTKDIRFDINYYFNKDNMLFNEKQIANISFKSFYSYDKPFDLYDMIKKILDLNKIEYEDSVLGVFNAFEEIDLYSIEDNFTDFINTYNVGDNIYFFNIDIDDYMYYIDFYDKDYNLIKKVNLFDGFNSSEYDEFTCNSIPIGDRVAVLITAIGEGKYYKGLLILDSNGNIISNDGKVYEYDDIDFFNHNLLANPIGGMFSNNNGLLDVTGLFSRDLRDIDRDNPKDIISKITLFNLPYKVNYNVKGDGNVILSNDKYYINDEVEINYDFKNGYELKSISIIDSNGNVIDIKDNKFIMPDGDITINAEFIKSENPFTSVFIYSSLIVLIVSGIALLLYRKNLEKLR